MRLDCANVRDFLAGRAARLRLSHVLSAPPSPFIAIHYNSSTGILMDICHDCCRYTTYPPPSLLSYCNVSTLAWNCCRQHPPNRNGHTLATPEHPRPPAHFHLASPCVLDCLPACLYQPVASSTVPASPDGGSSNYTLLVKLTRLLHMWYNYNCWLVSCLLYLLLSAGEVVHRPTANASYLSPIVHP